ncbi:choice-of-anchor D domain-containing protein [Edaphobacter sp.]|uniref:choice-of-anchor D domain-containing protein n=1 Tax=Edaphobacter sp. TaxID=1934404 RepID=UPI002DB74084|nr:choice-of-anchor D domain-containing protein [Edaphobacter sp.]HEU5341074.1 choice-of-anchor D domain-containing protein [Edaphobacter sp.]
MAAACVSGGLFAQSVSPPQVLPRISSSLAKSAHSVEARHFLSGRTLRGDVSSGLAMDAARGQQAAMLRQQDLLPHLTSLTTPWQPVGPGQVSSVRYGNVSGRVTSIAIDPSDPTGNTVYVGTTGGGLWKSTNAAGPATSVTFAPLTDTLPVFSANTGSSAIPSLSIGAVSVQNGVVLAGTGDPNDATDSYYGGGLLRSIDGGQSWTLISESHDGAAGNHSWVGLGFAGFAWSTASPGTVVAAISQSAEGTLVNAPDHTNSVMGLYYSTDSGAAWQMSTILDGSQTVQTPLPTGGDLGGRAATAVVWNPVRQRFYAAIRYHGYYESADGATWTRLADQPGSSLSLALCPTAPGTTGSVSCPIFRGALAVNPATGDTFALTVDSNNIDRGLWQDVCGLAGTSCATSDVTFGTRLTSTPLEAGAGSTAIPQADYNLSLAAVSSGAGAAADTLLYVGTVDLYRCSLAAGCALRNTTNAINGCSAPAQVAPAQHAIATLATAGQPLIYIGNDGGLWRSTDGVNQQSTPCSADDATHFQNLNSGIGSLAEVVSFAQDPTQPGTLIAGLGANGTAATSSAMLTTAWPQLSTGEGGTAAIDPNNPLLWYVSTAAGVSLRQCANGAACTAADFTGAPTIGYAQTSYDDALIDVPWLLDPALTSNVLIGTCRVWRGPAASGASWSSSNSISNLLGGPQNASCAASNPVIRSLAAGGSLSNATAAQNAGSQVLYAGMAGALDGGGSDGGHIFSTTSGGTAGSTTAWTDLSSSLVINDLSDAGRFNPGGFDISSLAADPHDSTGQTVYATVMGFAGNGINAPHVYRSVNGGASWTNISSNLPNAPANSIVIDPNDANTVYVALDTGVYVTTSVATCTTANCWSIYGTGMPNAPVVELAAAPRMPTGDGRQGELRAATYGRGIWQIPLLTAATAAQPAMALNPTSLTFTAQAVATASAAQTITVTNTGNAPLTVSSITASGDFNETDTCTAAIVAPSSTCSIQVRFLPTATGSRTGTLTVYGNVAGGQATVALTGTGTPAAAIVLNPIALTFASTLVNATSAPQNITISNTGGAAVTLQPPSVTGGFQLTANTCGAKLDPGTGCTVSVAFTPTASGARSGTFSITDDVGTQTASLTGTGLAPATDALSPLSLTFAVQQLTTTSAPQQITLTNSGDQPLTLISAQSASASFSVVNSCGNSLNAHSACSIEVAFAPQTLGTVTGTLTVADAYRSQTITLTGTGIAPPGVSLAPTSRMSFPATGVGIAAAAQTVTLTNNSAALLQLAAPVLTGDFAIVAGSDACGATLAPGTACTMQVAFTPTASTLRTGTLTISDNSPTSPHVLALSGTGVDFSLANDGNASQTVQSGQSAIFPLLLTSAAGTPGTAVFTCTGAPANSTCNVTPGSIALGSTSTISVTVQTGVGSTSDASGAHRSLWLTILLPLGLAGFRRRRLAGMALLCGLLVVSGCGSGRIIPPGGGSGSPSGAKTPAGTYNVAVSATSAGLTRATHLTLTVQ